MLALGSSTLRARQVHGTPMPLTRGAVANYPSSIGEKPPTVRVARLLGEFTHGALLDSSDEKQWDGDISFPDHKLLATLSTSLRLLRRVELD